MGNLTVLNLSAACIMQFPPLKAVMMNTTPNVKCFSAASPRRPRSQKPKNDMRMVSVDSIAKRLAAFSEEREQAPHTPQDAILTVEVQDSQLLDVIPLSTALETTVKSHDRANPGSLPISDPNLLNSRELGSCEDFPHFGHCPS